MLKWDVRIYGDLEGVYEYKSREIKKWKIFNVKRKNIGLKLGSIKRKRIRGNAGKMENI